jgi:erythromycin esterase
LIASDELASQDLPEDNYSMETSLDRQQKLLSWLRRHAIPLTTVAAGRGFADLQQLKPVVGNARIVPLGEATHGTREFFQLKHRLLEFLVTEMGFTTFAIEANWPESLAVNDYVLLGRGDPAKVLDGFHFWTWNTEEVLDLIIWMRQFNKRNTNKTKVKFAGFDAQFTALAATMIKEYSPA